jgi:protein TonB
MSRSRINTERSLKVPVVVAILAHVIAFALFPPLDAKPYRLPEGEPDPIVVVPVPEIDVQVARPTESPTIDGPITPNVDPAPAPPPPPPVPQASPQGNSNVPVFSNGPGTHDFVVYQDEPELIVLVKPAYPHLARHAGIEGTVTLVVTIEADGRVSDVQIWYSDATRAMEAEATAAAFKCRFRPARQRGRPVRARVTLPFEFRLR